MKFAGMEMATEAQKKKYKGMKLVEDHNPDFVAIIRAQAHKLARENGTVCADELRVWARDNNIHPKHQNAWGPVFKVGFRKVGYRPSVYPPSHGRVIAIWENK